MNRLRLSLGLGDKQDAPPPPNALKDKLGSFFDKMATHDKHRFATALRVQQQVISTVGMALEYEEYDHHVAFQLEDGKQRDDQLHQDILARQKKKMTSQASIARRLANVSKDEAAWRKHQMLSSKMLAAGTSFARLPPPTLVNPGPSATTLSPAGPPATAELQAASHGRVSVKFQAPPPPSSRLQALLAAYNSNDAGGDDKDWLDRQHPELEKKSGRGSQRWVYGTSSTASSSVYSRAASSNRQSIKSMASMVNDNDASWMNKTRNLVNGLLGKLSGDPAAAAAAPRLPPQPQAPTHLPPLLLCQPASDSLATPNVKQVPGDGPPAAAAAAAAPRHAIGAASALGTEGAAALPLPQARPPQQQPAQPATLPPHPPQASSLPRPDPTGEGASPSALIPPPLIPNGLTPAGPSLRHTAALGAEDTAHIAASSQAAAAAGVAGTAAGAAGAEAAAGAAGAGAAAGAAGAAAVAGAAGAESDATSPRPPAHAHDMVSRYVHHQQHRALAARQEECKAVVGDPPPALPLSHPPEPPQPPQPPQPSGYKEDQAAAATRRNQQKQLPELGKAAAQQQGQQQNRRDRGSSGGSAGSSSGSSSKAHAQQQAYQQGKDVAGVSGWVATGSTGGRLPVHPSQAAPFSCEALPQQAEEQQHQHQPHHEQQQQQQGYGNSAPDLPPLPPPPLVTCLVLPQLPAARAPRRPLHAQPSRQEIYSLPPAGIEPGVTATITNVHLGDVELPALARPGAMLPAMSGGALSGVGGGDWQKGGSSGAGGSPVAGQRQAGKAAARGPTRTLSTTAMPLPFVTKLPLLPAAPSR